jgi:hypothetical protein
MSSQDSEGCDAPQPLASKRQPAPLAPANVKELPSKSTKKIGQRKLTPKQQMKAKREKERDEKKASKQKEQELRASYIALTPCKTTLDPSEREPVVGDKLIVRDEYNVKYAYRCYYFAVTLLHLTRRGLKRCSHSA